MDMDIEDFLGAVKGGWNVQIGIRFGGGSGIQRIEAAKIADDSHADRAVAVTAADGRINVDEMLRALTFLDGVEKRDPNSQPELALYAECIAFRHPETAPSLPEGMNYSPQTDGTVRIVDENGNELGSIAQGGSIADATRAIMAAEETRAAEGLIANDSTELTADNPAMDETAQIASGEFEVVVVELKQWRPGVADSELAQAKLARIADLQERLFSGVQGKLVERGFVPTKADLNAEDLKNEAEDNKLRFDYTGDNPDKPTGYAITDPQAGQLIASGSLTRSWVRGRTYLNADQKKDLFRQLDEKRDSLISQLPALHAAEAEREKARTEIEKFAKGKEEEHSTGDHDRDHKGKPAAGPGVGH